MPSLIANLVALLLGMLIMAASAHAQSPGDGARTGQAVPLSEEITIDGRLDEAAWQEAEPMSGFIQQEPVEGREARHDTEVRVLYDDEAIYVGARMYDGNPDAISRQLTRRDQRGLTYDYFEAAFDSNHDRRSAYVFRVTAAGVQVDLYRYDDTRTDGSWRAVWESAVHHDDEGWSAELRIPLSQLRYQASADPQSWGVNFTRRRPANYEKTYFALESLEVHGGVSQFGTLTGLHFPRTVRNLEVRPYLLAEAHSAPTTPGDPFFDGSEGGLRAGLDFRYGLGSTFVLDGTVNPDFGQVEVDPAVINLTALETFYPEQRPFFSRDDQLFDFGLSGGRNRLFYSRRIGRSPQGGGPGDADFTSLPGEANILGAGKVTGRTAGGLSLGVLTAATRAETGRAYFEPDDRFTRFPVEPASRYGVVRAQQDLRGGASQVGAMLTGTDRSLPEDGDLGWLASRAYTGGVDFEHNWANRTWALWGFAAGSHVAGAPEAITRLQRSPNHYHQRPDADYLSVDSAATTMSGAEWRLQFERRGGRHWTGAVWAAQRTPGFEVDDLGFSSASERLDGGARITYREREPGDVLRSYRFNASTFGNWRHSLLQRPLSMDGWRHARKAGQMSLSADFTFLNYWDLDLSAAFQPEYLSDRATRGGPLMVSPSGRRFGISASTDSRAALSVQPSLGYESLNADGSALDMGVRTTWRPTAGTELQLRPRYERARDPAQYVTATDDPTFSPTFGRRYIFADIERREVSLETRLNMVFSPTLTLQLFAQPLLSSGDYVSYKQLDRAASFEFDRFEEGGVGSGDDTACVDGRTCALDGTRYIDFGGDGEVDLTLSDQDFTIRSLRGNAVLRWEFRAGSTAYLVWQQGRSARRNFGRLSMSRDAGALLSAPAENTIMFKVDYWLGI